MSLIATPAVRPLTKEHRDPLPDHVPPICMPEKKEVAKEIEHFNSGRFPRCEEGLGLAEKELTARSA